ncbi:MAG: M28 family peptidase [Gemmatimonadetes bacterium]|nr:MAG: M28 family peptidase [Gemmatimonadota bacterium]
MTVHRSVLASTALLGLLASCAPGAERGGALPGGVELSEERLRSDIRTLSSDAFEGRGPASPGEEKTVEFLVDQFRDIGLEPANGDAYTQEVPLVSITVEGRPALRFGGAGGASELAWGTDFVAWTKRVQEHVSLDDSELVFVGYGIVAPEYGWNDYEGLDVRGKTVVMLVNDPGFATQDPDLFNGNAMTYYGRWTYKYEEAARQGAAGALIVHETAPAGYPWAVVQGSWTGPQFGLESEDGNASRVAVEGWITGERARELFAMAGEDFDALQQAAARPGFRARPLPVRASVELDNHIERSVSRNVVGMLPGSERPDEAILFMAHWDHLGRTSDDVPDPIFNGAFDNATGTAGLLELARAFASLPERPARSLLFVAVTAEEQGLLGSAYYAEHPLVPTHKTVAAINMDGLNVLGPMRDVTVIGLGNSELDRYLLEAAQEQGRVLTPDPEPEKGFYYRSDHFSLAKVGIPSLYLEGGTDHVEHGREWTTQQKDDYTLNRYHKPSDEYDPSWDLRGAVQDLELLYRVAFTLANGDAWPEWAEGNEFRAIREADLAAHRD